MMTPNFNDQQSLIDDLQCELQKLHESTRAALELSWEEVRRLEEENEEKEDTILYLMERVQFLEDALRLKEENGEKETEKSIRDDDSDALLVEEFLGKLVGPDSPASSKVDLDDSFSDSSRRNSCPNLMQPMMRILKGISETSNESGSLNVDWPERVSAPRHRQSIQIGEISRKVSPSLVTPVTKMFKRKSDTELKLIKQLQLTEKERQEQVGMLSAEVEERNQAIHALEKSLKVRNDTVTELMNQVEFLVQWKRENETTKESACEPTPTEATEDMTVNSSLPGVIEVKIGSEISRLRQKILTEQSRHTSFHL